jgi:hypothetical protein
MSQGPYARLIVCEPKPRWAVLLRRFAAGIVLSEARSLLLAEEMLAASPASFIAVSAHANNATAALDRLAHWRRDYPQATIAILLDDPHDTLEIGFREAGAELVIAGLFDLPLVIRLAKRHLAQVDAPELDWREAVMARMPWPAARQSP